jgi:hypothetical protein
MFGAGNALVDVVDGNANVLAVSFVMLHVKVCPIRILSSSSTLWYNASDATGFNECLQGVDINELFEEFTEASVVKQSVNQQQIFNNCSVTIVYKKD